MRGQELGVLAHALGPTALALALLEALKTGTSLQKPAAPAVTRGLHDPVDGAFMSAVHIDPIRFRIPPVALPKILPQHLSILTSAADALEMAALDSARIASVIGMRLDPHIGESVIRWALNDDDRITPPLDAARVQGSLPNLVANRIAARFDLQGPSYTVSAGALSGLSALRHALGLLASGDVDAAVVGAVDLPGHGAHIAAGQGEAAVALVVAPLSSVPEDRVIAVIEDLTFGAGTPTEAPHHSLTGDCGAADGLVAALHALATGEETVRCHAWPSQARHGLGRPGLARPGLARPGLAKPCFRFLRFICSMFHFGAI